MPAKNRKKKAKAGKNGPAQVEEKAAQPKTDSSNEVEEKAAQPNTDPSNEGGDAAAKSKAGQPPEVFDVTLLCINAQGSPQRETIVKCCEETGADIVVVLEANETDCGVICNDLSQGSVIQWMEKAVKMNDKRGAHTILCLFKVSDPWDNLNILEEKKEEPFVTARATKTKDGQQVEVHIVIVTLPEMLFDQPKGSQNSDAQLRSAIVQDFPVIGIGNFNRSPKHIDKELQGNGTAAFVQGQLPTTYLDVQQPSDNQQSTSTPHRLLCTDNACANNYCKLLESYAKTIDTLTHRVFAVRYKVYNGKIVDKKGADTKEGNAKDSAAPDMSPIETVTPYLPEVQLLFISTGLQSTQRVDSTDKAEQENKITEIKDRIGKVLKKYKDDASVVAVVEAQYIKVFEETLDKETWEKKVENFELGTSENIYCFFNKKKLGAHVQFNKSTHGRFVTLKVKLYNNDKMDTKKTLNIMITHGVRKFTRKGLAHDVKEVAHNEMRVYWEKEIPNGPTIAFGDFNLKPVEIHELFENGSVAFKTNQLQTNAKVSKSFTDNAYASRDCELLSFYCEKIEGLEHKVFAVNYKLIHRD